VISRNISSRWRAVAAAHAGAKRARALDETVGGTEIKYSAPLQRQPVNLATGTNFAKV